MFEQFRNEVGETMDSPNAELMHLYETDRYYLEKTGQLPPEVAALTSAASFALYQHNRDKQRTLMLQAALMNQQLRTVEAEKERGTKAGFEGRLLPVSGRAPVEAGRSSVADVMMLRQVQDRVKYSHVGLSPEVEKVAQELGKYLAHQAYLDEMEKEAIIGGAMRFLGKGLSSAAGKLVDWGGKAGATGLRRTVGQSALKAESAGLNLAKKFTPVVGHRQTATQVIKQAPVGTGGAYRSPTGHQPVSHSVSAPQEVRRVMPPAPAAPTAAAPATPAVATAAPTAAAAPAVAKKPLIGWKTKAGLGLGATALGVGYLGSKAISEAGDYMRMPTHGGGGWSPYGAQVRSEISPYGY